MTAPSGGLKPRAVAGRPSVTRFTHKSCTGISASGMPSITVRKILTTSPIFDEIRYRMKDDVLLKMLRPCSIAETIVAKLSSASTISAASFATSVPVPIATPISARFSAGASFTPSPVIATTSLFFWSRSTSWLLCDGSVRERMTTLLATLAFFSGDIASNSRPVNDRSCTSSSGPNRPI